MHPCELICVLGGNRSESLIIILYSVSEQGYLVLTLYKHGLLNCIRIIHNKTLKEYVIYYATGWGRMCPLSSLSEWIWLKGAAIYWLLLPYISYWCRPHVIFLKNKGALTKSMHFGLQVELTRKWHKKPPYPLYPTDFRSILLRRSAVNSLILFVGHLHHFLQTNTEIILPRQGIWIYLWMDTTSNRFRKRLYGSLESYVPNHILMILFRKLTSDLFCFCCVFLRLWSTYI